MASHERDRAPVEGTPVGPDANRLAATPSLPSASDRRGGSHSSPGVVGRSGRASAHDSSPHPGARRRKPSRAASTYVLVDPAHAPRRPAPMREPLEVGTVVKFSGRDRETRARWGVAPYYLARVHAVERGERHDSRRARDRWRTAKDPADVGDFGADAALAADDEKIYSLQWFVPLDALVAVCPTANAYLGEAAYPLAQMCDVKANEQGRVELAVWKPPSFDSTARGDGEKKTYDSALACVAPRLYARQEFAETNLDETELCHFYDDRDLDEDVGVSTRTRYVWRFTFDPHKGFWPDPKKLRRDICCKMGSVHGTCAFNNFHVAGGGGYVMCDGCDRAHHLLCVGIDPKDVPAPEGAPGGFRPNRPLSEIGAVRGVRALQHFAGEEPREESLGAKGAARGGDGDGEKNENREEELEEDEKNEKRKKRRTAKPEAWFCGEACRRRYVTKQAKMLQAQLAQRKAEAEPEAEPTREEGEGAPGATRVPSASPNERLRRVSYA